MLKNFLSFLRFNLPEVRDKKQRLWNRWPAVEHWGEKFSNVELKGFIFDKFPSQTAATLRIKQSEERVKACWMEIERFDACANKFSTRESLQKCSPSSFCKVKFTKEMWKVKMHKHGDKDLFVEVPEPGVSFHVCRPKT